jgi:acetyl esterase/lipase
VYPEALGTHFSLIKDRQTCKAGRRVSACCGILSVIVCASSISAQNAPAPPRATPTYPNLDYAPADPTGTTGHKLDLYIPSGNSKPLPVVIWTGGSAWMATNGKDLAGILAAQLNPAGYAVAGVSIRSSFQVKFPGQLYDIKAAIRWLRSNATKYGLDPNHIAIMGDSSGGWTAAMAAVTGDAPEMEGNVGVTGVSSKVQAAVAFYPPTNFLTMDAWALRPCDPKVNELHGILP